MYRLTVICNFNTINIAGLYIRHIVFITRNYGSFTKESFFRWFIRIWVKSRLTITVELLAWILPCNAWASILFAEVWALSKFTSWALTWIFPEARFLPCDFFCCFNRNGFTLCRSRYKGANLALCSIFNIHTGGNQWWCWSSYFRYKISNITFCKAFRLVS